MNILSANEEDAEKIYSLLKKEKRTAYTKNLVMDLIESRASLALKAVEENNKVVGALGARAEGKNSAWLYFIVVDKEYRNEGIARSLNSELERRCRTKKIKRIALDTPDKSFFSKLGYKQAGKIPKWYGTKDQIIMFKKV